MLRNLVPNKVVALLTMSDIFTWGTYSVIGTISGIYLSDKLGVDAVRIVGIGTAIYFLARALFQIPVGITIDRIKNDGDEIVLLAVGSVLMGLSFVAYPLINSALTFYFLEFVFGTGTALNLNTWRKLFARNLDTDKEGMEYGIYEVFLSLSIAVFSVIAGYVANVNNHYFDLVIVTVGLLMVSAFIWPLFIFLVRKRKSHFARK